MTALGWALVGLARAIQWCRICYNEIFVFRLFRRWATKPLSGSVTLITPFGQAIEAVMGWASPTAHWLIDRANGMLPPLDPSEGRYIRLVR